MDYEGSGYIPTTKNKLRDENGSVYSWDFEQRIPWISTAVATKERETEGSTFLFLGTLQLFLKEL